MSFFNWTVDEIKDAIRAIYEDDSQSWKSRLHDIAAIRDYVDQVMILGGAQAMIDGGATLDDREDWDKHVQKILKS